MSSHNVTKSLVKNLRYITNSLEFWTEHGHKYDPVIDDLTAAGFDVNLTTTSLDVSVNGGKDLLITGFRILRRHGFEPSRRPEGKTSYFSTFFEKEGLKPVWFSFSSTVCQRVQVGTEYKEVPVYDIQCTGETEVTEEEIS